MRRFILWTGILTASAAGTVGQENTQSQYFSDPRLAKLVDFFDSFDCPIRDLAPDFLAAADMHGLDWRLLPSISVVESGGGKSYSKNNIFGWGSAKRAFGSVRGSIYEVASRLENSKLYRNKSLDALLATYNPRAGYTRKVKSVMRLVAADPPLNADYALQGRIIPASELPPQARLTPAQ